MIDLRLKKLGILQLCLQIEHFFPKMCGPPYFKDKRVENKLVNFEDLTLIVKEIEGSFMRKEPLIWANTTFLF